MASHYGYGRRKELQVGEFAETTLGFSWQRSLGSRSPIDLIAVRGSTRLAIQVKATRNESTAYTCLDIDGERALIRSAASERAQPVLALVARNYLWLVTVPDEQLLAEGNLGALKFDYPDET